MCNTAAPDFTTRQCGPGSSLTLHFIHSASARNILSVTGARNANLGAEFIKKNIGWFKSIELSTGCQSVRTIVVIVVIVRTIVVTAVAFYDTWKV